MRVPVALAVGGLARGVTRGRSGFVALAVGVAIAGCARPGAPTGGDVPTTPLRVVESTPAPLGVYEPFDGPVVIRFPRTLSERPTEGLATDAVIVSPRTGALRVEADGDRLVVSMEGGFVERTVYRVTVLPRFRDRFQNRMPVPYDLVFSTGPELEPNLLAGITQDRLTLRPVGAVRVDVVPVGGGPVRSAMSDSIGVFTFPYLPADRYDVIAYEDRNRNREPDFAERQYTTAVGINVGDTIVLTELPLLEPDTSAARAQSASLLDSLSVRIVFDDYLSGDYLDPAVGPGSITARLVREGANAPEVTEILLRPEWEARRADALRAAAGRGAAPPGAAPSVPPGAAPSAPPPLPVREIVLVLSRPLIAGAEYEVQLDGVVNVNEVPAGGGAVDLAGPPAPAAPAAPTPPGPGAP